MSSQWHYSNGGEQLGPVSSERLRELAASGELVPADLVWKEGLPDWRPASTLKGLFPESQSKPAGPPPLPTAKPDSQPPPLSAAALAGSDASSVIPPPTDGPTDPAPQRKPDCFDRARDLTQKAKAKAEAFQKEAQARAERLQKEAQANPYAAQAALARGARAAVDYARSDEAKELARKAQERVKGGAKVAADYARSDAGREQFRRLVEHPFVIGTALILFFPLGLYLVWRHPLWTSRVKWAWGGAWLCLVCLALIFGERASKEAFVSRPSASTNGDAAGYSQGKLASFGDHPPPIVESLSSGQEVWLLEDCDAIYKRSPRDRVALYLVFSGDDLACVVTKTHSVRHEGRAGDEANWPPFWAKYPAGKSVDKGSELVLYWTWTGKKYRRGEASGGSDETMSLSVLHESKPGTSPTVTDSETSAGSYVAIERYGGDLRWRMKATSSSTYIAKDGKMRMPPVVDSWNGSGSGRRLQTGTSNAQRPDTRGTRIATTPPGGVTPQGGGSNPTSALTADELRGEIVGEDFRPKSKFFDHYGEPKRVVDVGDKR